MLTNVTKADVIDVRPNIRLLQLLAHSDLGVAVGHIELNTFLANTYGLMHREKQQQAFLTCNSIPVTNPNRLERVLYEQLATEVASRHKIGLCPDTITNAPTLDYALAPAAGRH
jgi:hypothetical protein